MSPFIGNEKASRKFRNMYGREAAELRISIDQDLILFIEEADALQIAQWIVECGIQDDPFYLVNIGDIVRKYEVWRNKIPRVKPFYAVKCNDHPFVLNVLATLGTGFDCATKVEMKKVLDLGVDPSRIIFAHPTKLASHINYARESGVALMTFDNEFELRKIKNLYPAAKLVLRIRSDASVAIFPLGNKFGCNLKTEAPSLMRQARNLNLDIVGICFHVGSGCGELEAFARSIAAASELFVLGRELGFGMRLLDIGGGFRGDSGSSLDQVANIINTSLDKHFPEGCGVEIISEPGTYFVASAMLIAAQIHSKRTIRESTESNSKHNMYWINDGLYTSFDMVMHDPDLIRPTVLRVSSTNTRSPLIPSTIWGCVMSEADCIKADVRLPDLDVGDWLVFQNMGAYSNVIGRRIQGNPVPKFGAIVGPSTRPFVENLMRGDKFPMHVLPTPERCRRHDNDDIPSAGQRRGLPDSEMIVSLSARLISVCKRIGLWYTNKWSLT